MDTSRRLFYPNPLDDVEIHTAFQFRHPIQKGGGLFRDVSYTYFKSVETKRVEDADAIVLVHNFKKQLSPESEAYIRSYADTAEAHKIPLYIFSCGDWTDVLVFDPRVYVFRMSLYASTAGPKDIAIPTVTEDAPAELLFIRPKQEKAVVGFCGMGDFKRLRKWAKYLVENMLIDIKSLFVPAVEARKLGVYWRRAMMQSCSRSPRLINNFIVRKTFSGHAKSVELDPAQARKEYLETSANADFVLAPKGDGNYSNRFIKTLAFGRIPVLVDTDVVLPLEDIIPYEKIIVRVPMKEIKNTAHYIETFYNAHSEEEWMACQKLARETFLKHLVQDTFFKYFFENLLPSRSA